MSTVTIDSMAATDLPVRPSTRRVLLVTGAFLGMALPVFAGILLGLSTLLPGCLEGGADAPVLSGCVLAGVDMAPLFALLTPAILLALVTVPAGVLLCLAALLWPKNEATGSNRGGVDAVLQAALRDARAGRPARSRCPHCGSILLLTRVRVDDGKTQLRSACACGACDGSFDNV